MFGCVMRRDVITLNWVLVNYPRGNSGPLTIYFIALFALSMPEKYIINENNMKREENFYVSKN